jgi:hypothetical protein
MRLLSKLILALMAWPLLASAQNPDSGFRYASDYGQWNIPQGDGPANGSISWSTASLCSPISNGNLLHPIQVGHSIRIVDADPTKSETVVITAARTTGPSCTLNADMQYAHTSYSVTSGTAGLQEAIDAGVIAGRAVVAITPGWQALGGTTAMIPAALGSAAVSILDARISLLSSYLWNGTAYALAGGNGNVPSTGTVAGVRADTLLNYGRPEILKFLFSMHQSEEPGNAFPAKHILIHGDSTSVVCQYTLNVGPFNCRNRFPDVLGRILQQRYGNAGLGTTRIMAGPSNMDGYTWGVTSGTYTTVNTLGPWANNSWTQFNGLLRANSGLVLIFAANQPFAASNFYCATTADSQGWTLSIDGVPQTNLSGVTGRSLACGTQTSMATAVRESIPTQTLATHAYTMTCTTGPCYAYAADATNGLRGVVIDGLGVGGCVSQCFTGAASKYAFSDIIPNAVLDISFLGINDSASGTSITPVATYVANMQELWSHEAGLGIPLLTISPHYNNDGAYGNQQSYYSAMRGAAFTAGIPILDIQQRWGAQLGPCFIYRSPCSLTDPQSDLTHFADDGGLDIGGMIAAVLIDPNGPAIGNYDYTTTGNCPRDALTDLPPSCTRTDMNSNLFVRSTNLGTSLGAGVLIQNLNDAATGYTTPMDIEAKAIGINTHSSNPVCFGVESCLTPATLANGNARAFGFGDNLGGVYFSGDSKGNVFPVTLTLQTKSAEACNASHRGEFNYIAGAAGA